MDREFQPADFSQSVQTKHRNLPHWSLPGATYFVTFRCADSLPQRLLRAIRDAKARFLVRHKRPWSHEVAKSYQRRFPDRVERWLDRGYGECLLRLPEVRPIVVEALHFFDGERYILDRFVVMPNHVHALLKTLGEWDLEAVLFSLKSFTGNRINRLQGRRGEFWMDESYDRIVRSWDEVEFYRDYIEQNPANAGLQAHEFTLGAGISLVQGPFRPV